MASNAEVAAHILRNCADFFTSLGEQNEQLKEQMSSNAEACVTAAQLVETDPTGDSPVQVQADQEGGGQG